MADPRRTDPPKESGYQADAVNSRRVLQVTGVLLLTVLACLLGIAWLLKGLEARNASYQPPLTALERERLLPPVPRLEATPRLDGLRYRQEAEQQLDSYGWVDREQGIVHIPLAEAQKLTLEKGWSSTHAANTRAPHHEH